MRNLCCTFPKSSKPLDLVKNIFVVPVENVAVCMQDDDRPSERFNTFSKLTQFAILG